MEAADVVLRFLESVGRRSEAEYYLGLFRSDPKEQFAAISVDANVARHAAEAVVLDLRFLSELGLTPVVVLGLLATQEAQEHASRIHRRLQIAGIESTLLNAASASLHEEAKAAAQAGVIPLVVFGPVRQTSVDRRFVHLGELLSALKTRKLIFIHRPGGLRQKQVLLPLVNLSADYEALMASAELSRKEKLLLAQSRRLVFSLVPHKLNIAITSPLNLFRELFTVKGAGTLLRRGAKILAFDDSTKVDRQRLEELLRSSFGRAPYPEFFERPLARLYIEDQYRGAALVSQTEFGGFLTKFAVTRQAQGEGMARDLWELMHADFPTLFWRARPANPITEWYTKLCDGLARFPDWHVYWTGIAPERISSAIGFALAQPVDLPPLAPSDNGSSHFAVSDGNEETPSRRGKSKSQQRSSAAPRTKRSAKSASGNRMAKAASKASSKAGKKVRASTKPRGKKGEASSVKGSERSSERSSDRSSDGSSGGSSGGSSDRKSERSLARSPERSLDVSPDRSSDRKSDRSLDGSSDRSLDASPDRSPGRSPESSSRRISGRSRKGSPQTAPKGFSASSDSSESRAEPKVSTKDSPRKKRKNSSRPALKAKSKKSSDLEQTVVSQDHSSDFSSKKLDQKPGAVSAKAEAESDRKKKAVKKRAASSS